MESLELKFDNACDCWVLEPIEGFKPRPSNPTSTNRPSTDTLPSSIPSPTSNSAPPLQPLPRSGLSSPTYFNLRGLRKPSQGRFRKIVIRFWKCIKPRIQSSPAKKAKQGMKPGGASTKTRSSVQSPQAHHAEYYSTMSPDERDENLKAIIIYCRKSNSTESTEVVRKFQLHGSW